jgi:Methyltransferase domain
LTRQLRPLIPEVVEIDDDHASITAARDHPDASEIQDIEGDALTHEFEPTSFDLITTVASLHHMEAELALVHLRGLLRPGRMLAVIGLCRRYQGARGGEDRGTAYAELRPRSALHARSAPSMRPIENVAKASIERPPSQGPSVLYR